MRVADVLRFGLEALTRAFRHYSIPRKRFYKPEYKEFLGS